MTLYIKNKEGEVVDNISINFMGYGTQDKVKELKKVINENSQNNLFVVMRQLDNKISKHSTGKLFYYLTKDYTISFDYPTNTGSRRY